MSLKLPIEFAKKVADTFNWKLVVVDDFFDFSEDKEGFFWARLKLKKFLDKPDFRTMCALVRDLGGEDYLEGARAWKIAGPFVKKSGVTPQNASTSPTLFIPLSTPLQKAEKGPNGFDEENVESLKGSSHKIGYLYPVLTDSFGHVIDGFHRLKADPKWPIFKVDYVSDPLQLAKARLVANERRNVPAEEKKRDLDAIAQMTGWTPKKIAEDLGWSESKVYRYLSEEFKDANKATVGKLGGEAKGEAYEKAAITMQPKSQDSLQPQDMTVGKARELLDTPAGKEVLEMALKERLAETPSGEVSKSEDKEPLYADSIETVPEKDMEASESIPNEHVAHKESIPNAMSKPRNEEIDTGFEFCCPECQDRFQIIHVKRVDNGKIEHRLEAKTH